MVKSVRVCDAVGPLPVYMCLMVEQARINRLEFEEDEKREREKERSDREKLRAEKEKEKATPVIGNMVMSNPVVRTPAFCAPVVIPDIYLLSIFHRIHPPINWFTDERIQFAEQYGHQLASKQIRPIDTASTEKVTVFDVAKMAAIWGDDEAHSSFQAVRSLGGSKYGDMSPSKRPSEFDAPEARKVSRSTYDSHAGSSFRDQAHSFRESRNPQTPAEGARLPACLVCAGPHRVSDHPTASTSFSDGKPLFACRKGGDLFTVKPFRGAEPKKICGSFNIGKGCQANHPPHEHLHICSLCGNDHQALSRNPDCTRVALGNLLA
ncbi:hypothetical protein B0H13DRAFT_2326726 [Mycena leptocephala]|nr:hypothetical protein B0H13DRAFT_2326726 [Mycena leptocephala]